ncbi:MAG: phosphatidate cytidylyltransferase [Bacteroidales bacterium]|jgi:phosphatidate cytidylyltransferase
MNNTVIRTISGTIFLAIMIGALLTGPVIFALVMLFSIGLMMVEYMQMSLGKSFKTAQILSVMSGLLLYLFMFMNKGFGMDIKYIYLVSFPVLGIFITLLYEKNVESYNRHPYLISAFLYAALPFALTNFILFSNTGEYKPLILLSLFIITWSSDVGAYVIGMLFGQKKGHKLFPSISPKKSWEGFFGGLFFALLTGVLLFLLKLTDFPLIHMIAISLIINLFGVLGDLVESQLKRNFGVKDSGKLMPGHGGLLDRFDGALIAFPAAIAYIKLCSLI